MKPELSHARLEASLDAKIERYFDTLDTRVRASQSGLTQGFENKHHVLITHGCPVPFLSQATR